MPDEAKIEFIIGTTPEGRILIDFRTNKIDHLKLDQDMALDMAQALVEAVQQAKAGRIILPDWNNPATRGDRN